MKAEGKKRVYPFLVQKEKEVIVLSRTLRADLYVCGQRMGRGCHRVPRRSGEQVTFCSEGKRKL